MEAFHKIKIKCPYEILEIEEIKIKNKPNEHGYTYIKGIVDDNINFKYAIEASTEDKICIYEETVYFIVVSVAGFYDFMGFSAM